MTNLKRVFFLGLTALVLPACGHHRTFTTPDPLQILAVGGSGISTAAVAVGSPGGAISAFASGSILLTNATLGPSAPALPSAPTSGTELTNAMITAGTPISGNVLVSSNLQIAAGVNPATVTTNNGDVVIRGNLLGERSTGATTNSITISAPSGTIYVLGSIHTSGTPGSIDNPNAGNLTLTAQRIVVNGTLDASGETKGSAVGGNGGAVTLDTTGAGGTDIFFTGGVIQASGGAGASQGGRGGNVSLTAGNLLAVFGPILTAGGPANILATTPTGGAGGNVTLSGNAGANIWTSISLAGGDASGLVAGALGGQGGTFTAGSAAPYSIYGSIITSGGNASANFASAGSLTGGVAGSVQIGVPTPVTTLQLGSGTYVSNGGSGISSGGAAGGIDIESSDGDISIHGTLSAIGGGTGIGQANGGPVTIKTDANPAGNTSNHTLSLSGSILTYTSNGGTAGAVLLRCGGDLAASGGIDTSYKAGNSNAAPVTLLVAAVNQVPTGRMTVAGIITSEGSPAPAPGSSNSITLSAFAGVMFSGTLNTRGGTLGVPAGGPGPITIQSVSGDIDLSGSIIATADPTDFYTTAPAPTPTSLTVSTAGNISSSAMIDLSANPNFAPGNSNLQGANGGAVNFSSTGPLGSITLWPQSAINVDAANSTPGSTTSGGAGGSVVLTTQNQAISISGTVRARGGDFPSASGGLGGQVIANSNAGGVGTGGAITLTKGSTIDVSGGIGFTGGSARNNGGILPANSSGPNLAVIFDAAGGLSSSPDGIGGVVQNLGQITAPGYGPLGRGGDIWFDGKNAVGAELGSGDGGNIFSTAPGGNGVFFPN